MSDFQSFLDKSLAKIEIRDTDDTQTVIQDYDIYEEIRRQIVKIRKETGVTQLQLSEMTGLSQANISKIEKGMAKPTVESLKKIADALGKRLIIEFGNREELG